MRRLGMLANEYEEATKSPDGPRLPGAVSGLAEDYRRLTAEILDTYLARTTPLAADPWSAS